MPAGSDPSSVQRTSLRAQIADALRDEMMAGRLAAGSRFTVKEIADLYGVSATPAREALVDLSGQGLLRAEHHRGFTVTELSWLDFLSIMEARMLLTDGFFRHLGVTGDPDRGRLASLRRRAQAAAEAVRQGQLDVLVACDRRFWSEASGMLGNPWVSEYLEWLRVQSWMYASAQLRSAPDLVRECWDGHTELAERVEARDRAGVHRLIRQCNHAWVTLLARATGLQLPPGSRLELLLAEPADPAPGAAAPQAAPQEPVDGPAEGPAQGGARRPGAVPAQYDPRRTPGR